MALVKIVPEKDMEVLEKYLRICGTHEVILVPESSLNRFPAATASEIREMDDTGVPHNFGGEPDYSVDILRDFPSFQASELGLGGFD